MDIYGALHMSAAPADDANASDPALAVILDYLRAVITERVGAIWDDVAPGVPVVRTVHAHDPEDIAFNSAALPALYLFRVRGTPYQLAEDYYVTDDELTLVWVMPPKGGQEVEAMRRRAQSAVAKAVHLAIEAGQSPYWVHVRDNADSSAILAAKSTDTVAVSYFADDLDGAVGTNELTSPRRVIIAASAVTGAYSLDPIVVYGLDDDGNVVSDSITPTSVDGGWLVEGTTLFSRMTSVALPAQTLTTGTISVGHTADMQAAVEGSVLLLHAGMMQLRMGGHRYSVPLRIRIKNATEMVYETLQLTLMSRERWVDDVVDNTFPLDDIAVDIVRDDGTLIEQAILE